MHKDQWFTCQNKTFIVSRFWPYSEIKSNDSLIRYTVKEPEDQTWGAIDENGEWSGMIGQIVRKVKYSQFLQGILQIILYLKICF